jgi:hypothetical protein
MMTRRRVATFGDTARVSVFSFGRELTIAALAVALGLASMRVALAQEPPVPPSPKPAAAVPMPEIIVTAPKHKPKPKDAQRRPERIPPAVADNAATPAQAALDTAMTGLDQARDNLLPKTGASTATITRAAIEKLPQGDNTPIDKVVLQLPGVSYDTATSNPNFHVRN